MVSFDATVVGPDGRRRCRISFAAVPEARARYRFDTTPGHKKNRWILFTAFECQAPDNWVLCQG